ncbi:MAG: ubiquinone/menaquinone biosynthesis methyltransferase [Gammaproteobacteria bacterium]|jgi:demethylmenaquinone methyltransferase/2-methoxy-6-polyprenyl-1,4-benzoquinol methylase|nr:ubiquinone/menaquinone biosynthesis methyltransferase [Gammaproteobacteria bacterium]
MPTERKHFFGFEVLSAENKTEKVQSVFSNVATYYDLMNDVMSLGTHRLWKSQLIDLVAPENHDLILDLACGTGDLTRRVIERSPNTNVIMCDLNWSMLKTGLKTIQSPFVSTIQANAESLPFINELFSKSMIAFGIRNVTDVPKALSELYRTCKHQGKVFIMEFGIPASEPEKTISKAYLNHVLPLMGDMIAGDKASYDYLAKSIQKFPNNEQFQSMLYQSGFSQVSITPILFGAVNIFSALKTK